MSLDDDDEQQLLKQNLDSLDEININTETKKSNKYDLYMEQMSPYMQRYTQDSMFVKNLTTQYCQHCSSVENYLYYKKRKTLKLQTSDFFLEVIILNSTKCKDYILTNIRYNYQIFYNASISISADQSPFHDNCTFSSGNFANVYKAKIQKISYAIKCFKINEQKSLSSQFMKILKEYILFAVASLESAAPGPQLIKTFRIMIYRNCIEFPMELCQEVLTYCPKMEDDIKQAMVKLHKNHMIHFDIKPQNICYCPRLKKFVLIDFGLSEIIPQKLGETKILSFRGSLGYCSQQMKACSRLSFAEIDPYYNDLHCLNQSMKIFKQLNLNPHQQQILPQLNSQFKDISGKTFQLSFQSNKTYGSLIVKKIQQTDSMREWQQMVKLLKKFQYPMHFNIRDQLRRQKVKKKVQTIGQQLERLRNSEITIRQEQILSIYNEIFQPEQNVASQTYPQKYYIYTDILSISEKYDQKLTFIKHILQQNGIITIDISDQLLLREYYVRLLTKLQQSMDYLNDFIQFAHFLPSFILFEIISADRILLNFQKCLLSFEKNYTQNKDLKKWTLTIFKFLMAIQWMQYTIFYNYHYDSIAQLIFELLDQSNQRTPAKQVDYKTSQIPYILLNLAVKFKRASTNHDIYFLNRALQLLGLYRLVTDEFQQIVQYLVCLMMKKIPCNFISKSYFDRKLALFIEENQYHLHYKLYAYYINVFICLYQLESNKQSWIQERVKISFQGFSFFRKTLLHYFHKQILLNFAQLTSQISKIADDISESRNRVIYIHRIVKMFLYNKYGAFINNQTELNTCVLTLGQSYNILPYFFDRIFYYSQKYPHRSHEEYNTEIAIIFRYFIASIISQNPLDFEKYNLFHQRKTQQPLQSIFLETNKPTVHYNLNEKPLGNKNIFIYIGLFINIIQQLPTPDCIICKVRYAVYLQLLRSIKILYQERQNTSLQSFTRLIIYSHRQQQLKQFLTEALSVYFYFCSLKNIQYKRHLYMINLAMQIIHFNHFQLYHIILCANELYIQIFKQTLIKFPNSAVEKMILPTIQNIQSVSNSKFCQKMQYTFLRSWHILKKQIPQQHFLQISNKHFSNLMFMTNLAINKNQSVLFELLGYVLAFMKHFRLQFQRNIKLYKFISIAFENQTNKLKQFYIGRFYEVFWKKVESLRFSKFKSKMILKLRILSKFDSNTLIRHIRMKMKQGDISQKKFYSNFYKKMTRFAQQNVIIY